MEKIKTLMKKLTSREVILYFVFGITTTIINLLTFRILTNVFSWEENLSSFMGVILAVLVAYITNRKWVFQTTAKGFRENAREFIKFMGARAVTMVLEVVGFFLLFNLLHIQRDISKLSITVIVVIVNYFFSRFFVFTKSK